MTDHISQVPRKVKKKKNFWGEAVLYKGKAVDLIRSCIKQYELHPNIAGKRKKKSYFKS